MDPGKDTGGSSHRRDTAGAPEHQPEREQQANLRFQPAIDDRDALMSYLRQVTEQYNARRMAQLTNLIYRRSSENNTPLEEAKTADDLQTNVRQISQSAADGTEASVLAPTANLPAVAALGLLLSAQGQNRPDNQQGEPQEQVAASTQITVQDLAHTGLERTSLSQRPQQRPRQRQTSSTSSEQHQAKQASRISGTSEGAEPAAASEFNQAHDDDDDDVRKPPAKKKRASPAATPAAASTRRKRKTVSSSKSPPVARRRSSDSSTRAPPPRQHASSDHSSRRRIDPWSIPQLAALDEESRASIQRVKTMSFNLYAPDPEQDSPPEETTQERKRRKERINGRRKRTKKLIEIDQLHDQAVELAEQNDNLRSENAILRERISIFRGTLDQRHSSERTAEEKTATEQRMLPPQHIVDQPIMTATAQGYTHQASYYERSSLVQARASSEPDISTSQALSNNTTRSLSQQVPSAETSPPQGLSMLPARAPESQRPSQQSTHTFPLSRLQPSSMTSSSSFPTDVAHAFQQQLQAQLGMFLQPHTYGQQQQGTQQVTLQQILQQQQQQLSQQSLAAPLSLPQPHSQQRQINTSLLSLQQSNLLTQILQQQISMNQGNMNLNLNNPPMDATVASDATASQQQRYTVAQSQLEAWYAAFTRGQQQPQQPQQPPRQAPPGSPSSKKD